MNAPIIDSRPLYGIGTVARLAKLKPDTLRIWERRYGLGASQKTDSGRRLYTQTDLDHLQIVSKLVGNGFRIGEIATLERKTLAALAESEGVSSRGQENAQQRLRLLFAGERLCQWLDKHPGCLSRLDSRLLRAPLEQLPTALQEEQLEVDALVIHCERVGSAQVAALEQLRAQFEGSAILLYCGSEPGANLATQLLAARIRVETRPLTAELFGSSLRDIQCQLETELGNNDLGDLVSAQPVLFDNKELRKIAEAPSHLACACSQHLANLIESLQEFEAYSRDCEVENWNDAAAHACIYAYTNQARWLMEKALGIALDESGHDTK